MYPSRCLVIYAGHGQKHQGLQFVLAQTPWFQAIISHHKPSIFGLQKRITRTHTPSAEVEDGLLKFNNLLITSAPSAEARAELGCQPKLARHE